MAALARGVRKMRREPMLSAFNGDEALLDANIKAICSLSGREVHLMNVRDGEYARLFEEARSIGARWKGRTRDFKGQFCSLKYEANVLWGRSHRTFDWTVVLPWTFGQLLLPLSYEINSTVVRNDPQARARLAAHEQEMRRNYQTSSGLRAEHRKLADRVHRQILTGRRNHFVRVS